MMLFETLKDALQPPGDVGRPTDVPSWHEYFLLVADVIALRSKDPSVKVGAVVVGPDMEIRSTGYNGFPRGVYDTGTGIQAEGGPMEVVDWGKRWERPEKYNWVVHAEQNAVLAAARIGVSLKECTMVVNWAGCPCNLCTPAIIQAGITRVVMGPREFPGKGNGTHYSLKDSAPRMLKEAGVDLIQL